MKRDFVFTPEIAEAIRLKFVAAGWKRPDDWPHDNHAVNLNDADMSYKGWVPSDMAQAIWSGQISDEQIPKEYKNDACDRIYAAMKDTRTPWNDGSIQPVVRGLEP